MTPFTKKQNFTPDSLTTTTFPYPNILPKRFGVQRAGGAVGGVGEEWWANMEDKRGDNGEHDLKEDVDKEMEEETHQHGARGKRRALAPEPPRATCSQPESEFSATKPFFFHFSEFSLYLHQLYKPKVK